MAHPSAGGNPVLDAVMIDTDITAAEILQGVKSQIRVPRTATAVDDRFSPWVETRRPEYPLNAIGRNEIFGIFVTQNLCRITVVDGTRNVSFGIGISRSYVPNNCISRYSLGDIGAIG